MDKSKYSIILLILGVLIIAGGTFILSRPKAHPTQAASSPFAQLVSLEANSAGYLTLRIIGSYSDPIRINGWTLTNGTTTIRIPEGAVLLKQGVVNVEAPITLYPGEYALINSGPSPVGTSFRINTCSPLLERFQTFTPSLRTTDTANEEFYNDCVNTHQHDPDFYKGEWRIFTGTTTPLINGVHGVLTVKDEQGLTVTTLSY